MIVTAFAFGNTWVWLIGVVLLTLGAMVRWHAHLLLTDGMYNRLVIRQMPWLIERPSFEIGWWVLMGVYFFLLGLATIQWFALGAVLLKNAYWGVVVILVLRLKQRRKASWKGPL